MYASCYGYFFISIHFSHFIIPFEKNFYNSRKFSRLYNLTQKTKYEKHRLWIDISNKLWQKNIINLIIIIQK